MNRFFKKPLGISLIVSFALVAAIAFPQSAANAAAKKATRAATKVVAKPAAPKLVKLKPFDGTVVGKTMVVDLYLNKTDGDYLLFDRPILQENPNASIRDYDQWTDAAANLVGNQQVINNYFSDAAAEGMTSLFFIQSNRKRRVMNYLSATPRNVSLSIASNYQSDPNYAYWQGEYNRAQQDMQYAGDRGAEAGRQAANQAASNPLGALFTTLGAATNDYGYNDAKKRAENAQAQMNALQQPKWVAVTTLDVSREMFMDGELAIYFCDVKSKLCGYLPKPVSHFARIDSPISYFNGEAAYSAYSNSANAWTEFNNQAAAKSKFGFTLDQLYSAVNGSMMDIGASKLASRITADSDLFFKTVIAKQDANRPASDQLIVSMAPTLQQLVPYNRIEFEITKGMFEGDQLRTAIKRISDEAAAVAAEAERRKNLQGL